MGKIDWPRDGSIPRDAQDLISRLLKQEPGLRLGSDGAQEVKDHSFFNEIDWDTLCVQDSPFKSVLDLSEEHTDGAEYELAFNFQENLVDDEE